MTKDDVAAILRLIQPGISDVDIQASIAGIDAVPHNTPEQQRSVMFGVVIAGFQAERKLDEANKLIALYQSALGNVLDTLAALPLGDGLGGTDNVKP